MLQNLRCWIVSNCKLSNIHLHNNGNVVYERYIHVIMLTYIQLKPCCNANYGRCYNVAMEPVAMPVVLYNSNSSPPSRAVRMVACVLGLELELRDLNPVSREQDTPELTEKNPMRTVPLLDEGDYCLADSHAIIIYLFEKYGKPQHSYLYPTDSRKRATVNQRLFFENGILFPRLRSVMAPTFRGKLTELSRSMKINIEDAYRTLEAYLSDTLYVAGDCMTLADISILTTVSTLDGIHPIDDTRYPKLKKWLLRMTQKDFCQLHNEPGTQELIMGLKTIMKNNRNQPSKL